MGSSSVQDDIVSRLDADKIATLLSRYQATAKGSYVTLDCPKCGHRKEAYAYVSCTVWPVIKCNRQNDIHCQYDESLWAWLKSEHGGDEDAAYCTIGTLTGVWRPDAPRTAQAGAYSRRAVRQQQEAARWIPKPKLTQQPREIPAGLDEQQAQFQAALPGSPGEAYFKWRGLALDEALSMGFGYCAAFPLGGKSMVTYPLRNQAGGIVAIEGRLCIIGVSPKDKCRAIGAKRAGLFMPCGTFNAANLHITEGCMDAVALCMAGLNAAATCGTGIPDWLADACLSQDIWSAHDKDVTGAKRAAFLITTLQAGGTGIYVRRLKPHGMATKDGVKVPAKDWGDYLHGPRAELLQAVNNPAASTMPAKLPAGATDPESMQTELAAITKKMDFVRSGRQHPKYTLGELMTRIKADIDSFAAKCDLPEGFTDPGDDFAADALTGLRYDFSTLAPQLQAPISAPETIPAATVEMLTGTLDLGNTGADRTHR